MPRSFLKKEYFLTSDMNKLANFAIISAQDNKRLGGVAPSVYKNLMDASAVDTVLEAALCPHSLFDDDFNSFLAARARSLADHATKLIS